MKPTILLCVALTSASSWGQDHLEPEDAVYSTSQLDYRVAVGKVLGRALPYKLPKVIVLPSNQKEYIVGIAPEATGCAVVFGRADFLLWTYEVASSEPERRLDLLRGYPQDPLDVPVSIQRRAVDSALCDRIANVWEKALLPTRYWTCPSDQLCEIVVDGVSFHFSTWVRGMGVLAGQTHSPKSDSPLGQLTGLVYAMRRYAEADAQVGSRGLEQALERAEEALW